MIVKMAGFNICFTSDLCSVLSTHSFATLLGKGSKKKNVPFSSLLLLRGPATLPPPLVVPWAIKILGPYFFVK